MKYTEEEEYAIGYYLDKEICAEIEIKDDKGEFLKALGITENDNFESHLIRVKTLLHLIEKQNKEIDEKDKRIFFLEIEARKIIEQNIDKEKINLYENYISKEAIREKIKELKNKFSTNDDLFNGIVYKSQIDILKELLGEWI